MSERVGSINTYLGLTKNQPTAENAPNPTLAGQNRVLVLSILNGNTNGVSFFMLQSLVSSSMTADVLRDLISDLRKRDLVQVEAIDDPLNPVVKITQKGQEQLSLLAS